MNQKSKFKKTEMGMIPEEWEVKIIEDFLDIKHGFAFKVEFFSDAETDNILLTPGRYVGAEEEEEDTEVFEEKMKRLTSELSKQMKEGKKLDEEIRKNLRGIGYGFWTIKTAFTGKRKSYSWI